MNESSGVQVSLAGFVFSVIITHCCSTRQNVGIDLVATMNLKVHLNFSMKINCVLIIAVSNFICAPGCDKLFA